VVTEREKAHKRARYYAHKAQVLLDKKAERLANPEKSRAISRAYYQKNKELIAARLRAKRKDPKWAATDASQKKAYALANPQKVAEYQKAYRLAHKEKAKEKNKAYRAANQEKLKASNRKWREANREYLKSLNKKAYATNKEQRIKDSIPIVARRRARKLAAFVEDVDRSVVFERDAGVCGICNLPVNLDDWHLDHIQPLSKGGEHSYANTQVSHPTCNMRKGAKL